MADREIEGVANSSGSTDDGVQDNDQPHSLGNSFYWADPILGYYRKVPNEKVIGQKQDIIDFDQKLHDLVRCALKGINSWNIKKFIRHPENFVHLDVSLKLNQLLESDPLILTQCDRVELDEISLFWRAILCDYYLTASLLVPYVGTDLNVPWGTRTPKIIDPKWTALDVLVQQPTSPELLPLINLMLKHGADMRRVDSYGQTVLHLAITERSVDLMKLLLEKIRDNNQDIINVADGDGKTPLLAVADRGFNKEDQDKIISLLVDQKAKVDAKDNHHRNILHHMKSCSHELVKKIIARGASLKDYEESYNYQPIHMAAMTGDDALLQSYIKLGADVNVQANEGMFPLYLAAKLEDSTKLRTLLLYGACPLLKTAQGKYKSSTALHAACSSFNDESIQTLLQYNADLLAEDDDGKTPFDLIKDEFTSLQHRSIEMMIKKLVEIGAPLPSSKKENEELLRHYNEISNQHLQKPRTED